jgi:hypothetical protein
MMKVSFGARSRKKQRIFIGLAEVAGIGAAYTKAFQTLGYPAYTVMIAKNPYFTHEKYDIVISEKIGCFQAQPISRIIPSWIYAVWLVGKQFIKALITCDIFIFIFGSSFLPKCRDYAIFKFFNKKVVSVFCGCDIRHWSAYEQEFESLGLDASFKSVCKECDHSSTCYLTRKLRTVQSAEKCSNLILSQRTMSQLLTRPYMRVNIPLVLNEYDFNIPARDVPLVVHAPTNRAIKGTTYIMEAVERLRQDDIKFEFHLIEGVNNVELRKILSAADIVVDYLFVQTVGVLALEAMATGNAVLSGKMSDYELFPGDCPVVSINTSNIYGNLKQLILDKDYRVALACAGREYVETYHDHLVIAKQILEWLEPGGIVSYDYYPEFAKKHYKIPQKLIEEEKKVVRKPFIQKYIRFFSKLNNTNKDN